MGAFTALLPGVKGVRDAEMQGVGRGGDLAVAERLVEPRGPAAVSDLQRGPSLGAQLGVDAGQARQGGDLSGGQGAGLGAEVGEQEDLQRWATSAVHMEGGTCAGGFSARRQHAFQ